MNTSIILQTMTHTEAQEWKARIGNTASQLRLLLHEGYERGAWEALGYSNWTDCLKALAEEYGFTERRLWQLHSANQTEKLLNPGSVGEMPEKHLRPLTSLEPDTQREVYQKATETAPNGKVTAAHVEQTKREYLNPVPDDTDEQLGDMAGAEDGYDWTDEEQEVKEQPTQNTDEDRRWAMLDQKCGDLFTKWQASRSKEEWDDYREELYDTMTEFDNERTIFYGQ